MVRRLNGEEDLELDVVLILVLSTKVGETSVLLEGV